MYVMGYYNAMPYLPSGAQEKVTIPILKGINKAIEIPAEDLYATYVPTFQSFEGKKGIFPIHQTFIRVRQDTEPLQMDS